MQFQIFRVFLIAWRQGETYSKLNLGTISLRAVILIFPRKQEMKYNPYTTILNFPFSARKQIKIRVIAESRPRNFDVVAGHFYDFANW